MAFEAGRIMLSRIDELIKDQVDFAIETTLSTRSYVSMVLDAQRKGYCVTLLYVWLESAAVAVERVAERVAEGGHNIPSDIIHRRYQRGLHNLLHLYIPIVDFWVVVNNTHNKLERISTGNKKLVHEIYLPYIWTQIQSVANGQL